MNVDRRVAISAGLSLGTAFAGQAIAGARPAPGTSAQAIPARDLAGRANSGRDQTDALQAVIDSAAQAGRPLQLDPGTYTCRSLQLRPGSHLLGTPGKTVIEQAGNAPALSGAGADGIRLEGLIIEGTTSVGRTPQIALQQCRDLTISSLQVRGGKSHGIKLDACSGRVTDCDLRDIGEAAIFAIDSTGLLIAHNNIAGCGDNGILVWRSVAGEDGTIVTANRIERIAAKSGGSGQNGNGINIFRAAGVLVTGNRILDCAYTAVRGNAASNIQILGNSCARLGEVALYAEFGFEGALIANNLVDGAACGISVTNFNEGGRLAVVQGNVVRNLHRRDHEPVDKRGEGIAVEADAVVSGNVVENAPTAGIVIGWGAWMRDVAASSNVIRNARVGIAVTADPAAGTCLITGNMISAATEGSIRGMLRGTLVGGDLAKETTRNPRIAVSGNVTVERSA